MEIKPDFGYDTYVGHNKLKDKVFPASKYQVCYLQPPARLS